MDPTIEKAKSFTKDSLWRIEGPNISCKAWIGDSRPWVERFWIARFGNQNKGHRILRTGKEAVNKTTEAYKAITQPIQTIVSNDLQRLMNIASGASGEAAKA